MKLLRKFLAQKKATIAVEFAFVAPLLLAFFFGLNELALALGAKANVYNLTSTGADLVAQEKTVAPADMTNVFSAMAALLYPYDPSSAQMTITSVIDNSSTTTGKVAWSCTHGGTARSKDSIYTFPTSALGVVPSGGGSVIMSEVQYTYTLPVQVKLAGYINVSGPFTMSHVFYVKPRRVAQIPSTGCP